MERPKVKTAGLSPAMVAWVNAHADLIKFSETANEIRKSGFLTTIEKNEELINAQLKMSSRTYASLLRENIEILLRSDINQQAPDSKYTVLTGLWNDALQKVKLELANANSYYHTALP